jgi:hypothetical protein
MRSSTDELENDQRGYDAGDAASVKDAQKKAKQREARRLNGLKQIMGSADGRLWMWSFLETCGLFHVVFNGNSRDYFNLGQRNAAMPVFAAIQQHCMDEYLLMVKENSNV